MVTVNYTLECNAKYGKKVATTQNEIYLSPTEIRDKTEPPKKWSPQGYPPFNGAAKVAEPEGDMSHAGTMRSMERAD